MPTYLCPVCEGSLDSKGYCVCGRSFPITDRLTESQIDQQDIVDNACSDLIRQFVPDYTHDIQQISLIRQALVSVLDRFYSKPPYEIYPWLLEPTPVESPAFPERVIEHSGREIVRVKASLPDWDEDTDASAMPIEVVVYPHGIEIVVPDVETFSDAPGHAIPIYIDQDNGELTLLAWGQIQRRPGVEKGFRATRGS